MIVDPLPAAAFVAQSFGWSEATAMTPAAEGAMGRIWQLGTVTGSFAVKELYWAKDAEAEEAVVARQVGFCDLARAAGVVAPGSLMAESGRFLVTLPQHLGGRLVRAYEWIEGRAVNASDDGAIAWAGQTHALIEGLNVSAGYQQVDPWSYVPPTAAAWNTLAGRCTEAREPWAEELRQTIVKFVALTDTLRAPDPADLIITHTDFQPQNVLVDTDGGFVLLDWDDAGPSTRSRALGSLINNWHLHGSRFDLEGMRRTLRAYWSAGGTATISEVDDFGDAICGYLNYVYGQANLSTDPTQRSVLRTDASQRMPGLLHPPPVAAYEEAVQAQVRF